MSFTTAHPIKNLPRSSNSDNVIDALLGSQFFQDQGWYTINPTESSFQQLLLLSDCSFRLESEFQSDLFQSHAILLLPDNPPNETTSTEVHRFQFNQALALDINKKLSQTGLQMANEATETSSDTISNIDGYHSKEEMFETEKQDWYSDLLPFIQAAFLSIDETTSLDFTVCDEQSLPLSGWLNVSDVNAFNALHDHGTSKWSCVYFVNDGSSIEQKDKTKEQETRGTVAPGSLLLRTQLKPFTHEYAYLPIPPVPGELWVFPGYLPHAVLPRGGDVSKMRISVACNAGVNE